MAKVIGVGELANLLSLFTQLRLTTVYYLLPSYSSSRLKLFSGKALEAALQSSWVEQSTGTENEKGKKVSSLFSAAEEGWSQALKLWAVAQKNTERGLL